MSNTLVTADLIPVLNYSYLDVGAGEAVAVYRP